ncbi:MAG: ISL3 family transposase, partial [Clostridiales bacterium]|nr:ISL3 family transposase [Clostridiales bacterium]
MGPEFQNQIFSQALNIQKPWYISRIEFKQEEKRLDIWVDFERGAKFSCPDCGEENCEIHDTVEKEWR